MKKIATLLCFSVIAGMANAQKIQPATAQPAAAVDSKAAAAVTPSPDLLILKETEYDFGKIPQGKPVTHVFNVSNKSTDSLKISNVQASCGCTTPSWERDKAVAPGTETNITVGYNAAAEGPFTKLITIAYNEGQTKTITIKGEVWKTPATSAPENKAASDLKN